MNKVPDRKRLRQEYIKKKSSAYGNAGIYAILFIPVFLLAVGTGCTVVESTLLLIFNRQLPNPWGVASDIAGGAFLCILSGPASWYCRKRMKESEQLAAQVPYVPPVTPNTLSADEILVRASEEPPVAHSEVLLRAAKGQETPKEELLRVAEE